MKQELIECIENAFGYPVYLQGSMTNDAVYPTSFFTFWNIETQSTSYYDNQEHQCVWSFWLNFYSIDPMLVDTVILQVREVLKENGWIVPSKGQDINSGNQEHSGRSLEIHKIEIER